MACGVRAQPGEGPWRGIAPKQSQRVGLGGLYYTGNMHLARSPLVLVLVQARFPKRIGMETDVEAFRKECDALGYPLFHEGSVQTIGIGIPGTPVASMPRWDFLDRTRHWNIVLTQDFLLLQTSEYHRFQEFLDRWKRILHAAHRTLGVRLIDRLGLRYVDLVQPTASERVADYVVQALAGYEPEPDSGFHRERHVAATVLRTDKGQMLVRVSPATSPFPPDMDSVHLIGLKSPAPGAVFLDFDHASSDVIDFEPQIIAAATSGLHDAHDLLFGKIATPYAMTAWGREDTP